MMGRKEMPGRPIIYGTTKTFLELFGLNTLADLPAPKEIQIPPMPKEMPKEEILKVKDKVEVKAETEAESNAELRDPVIQENFPVDKAEE
jgi:segregation and condensation protein B